MSNMLKVAEEIEEKLKSVGLVGSRLGSGFSFIDDSRDVQFEYPKEIVEGIKEITNNYYINLEKIVNEIISQYDDLRVCFTYRLDNFSFYISPKREECECKCEEEVCEDEKYDVEIVAEPNPISTLLIDNQRAELLLKAVDFYTNHVPLELEDIKEVDVLQTELMNYMKEDE